MADFKDRRQAAQLLAKALRKVVIDSEALAFGVLKGGALVAQEISSLLGFPFEVIACQKIPVPHKPERSFGAISEGGFLALNKPLIRHLGFSEQYIRYLAQKEKEKIVSFLESLPLSRPLPSLNKKTAIIVDDGLASGYTMLAALREIKSLKPQKIIVAVPCASLLAYQTIEKEAEKIIALKINSKPLFTIADSYEEWEELTERDLKLILKKPNVS